jgi:hypothetical protein
MKSSEPTIGILAVSNKFNFNDVRFAEERLNNPPVTSDFEAVTVGGSP